MTKISQNELILNYLKSGNSITPLEALEKFGCFRLGARIWELEKNGYFIQSKIIELPNGKHCASYCLKQKQMEMFVA